MKLKYTPYQQTVTIRNGLEIEVPASIGEKFVITIDRNGAVIIWKSQYEFDLRVDDLNEFWSPDEEDGNLSWWILGYIEGMVEPDFDYTKEIYYFS
ncbi:hypothetical protein ASwh1_27 [Aeromonas phage Aswh_1]|nr:hypothetical protein ASwh1_27 [Aeromonas phage Aswh_1]